MIAEVVLQAYSVQNETFSYLVPDELLSSIQIGQFVNVPFRAKTEKGIILELKQMPPVSSLKSLLSIIQPEPILWPYQIALAHWIGDYYVAPLFKVINLFLPNYLWEEKKEDWVERSLLVALVPGASLKGSVAAQLQEVLLREGSMDYNQLRKHLPKLSLAYLRGLEKKGTLTITAGEIIPPYFKTYDLDAITVVKGQGLKGLTADQNKALDQIQAGPEKIFLLHGITGSGKTEIYLHQAYENFTHGKQTIILVPEIALTPQLIGYFFKVFGKHISVLHSQLSDGEKFTEWVRIKQKDSFVIIGSRSALFSPVQDVGTIILDEEHEWTYKNDQSPRYHARETAIQMARLLKATVILGSATPDVESYYKAQQGEYTLLELPKKIGGD